MIWRLSRELACALGACSIDYGRASVLGSAFVESAVTKAKYTSHVSLYAIGSLRNPQIPIIANSLRQAQHPVNLEIFDDWFAGGPLADDSWRDYEKGRGHDYKTALERHTARHIFSFDLFHLNRAHGGVLIFPAGRSAHLECGFLTGQGKPTFMLLTEGQSPERLDVMTQFLYAICHSVEELQEKISQYPWPKFPPIPFLAVDDAQWLAGILEGEGSFCLSRHGGKVVPRLMLQMTDEDVIRRAAKIMDRTVFGPYSRNAPRKSVWACGVAGLPAIEWMRILRPMLGSRRQGQILDTVKGWLRHRAHHKRDGIAWRKMFHLTEEVMQEEDNGPGRRTVDYAPWNA